MLINETISRQNKLWIAIAWAQLRGWFVEWKWAGDPPSLNGVMHSRLCFRFEPDGPWTEAKSYDEDIRPTLKFSKDG